MKKIAVIFGTRPEIIKLYPVIKVLKGFKIVTVFTGQHKDLGKQMLDLFKIKPDYDLGIMIPGSSLATLTAELHDEIDLILEKEKPDLVMVQGDTTTAFVGALEAYYHQIPVAHIEAGLRTDNIYNPFPEEINRRLISQIATHNFAPTYKSWGNLKGVWGEGLVTGNTGIDTLLGVSKEIQAKQKQLVLMTLHRRESFGEKLEGMMKAIRRFADAYPEIEVLFPVHLNPNVQKVAKEVLKDHPRIILSKPLDYIDMVRAMKECLFIVTDSGGLQEEAPSLNKPILVLRDETERPEGILVGVSRLVGTNPQNVYQACCDLMNPILYKKMTGKKNPYGDGKASNRIAQYLRRYYG